MDKTSDRQTPEGLLTQITAQYERYLEIADVSRVGSTGETESVGEPDPAPLGLVIWPQ